MEIEEFRTRFDEAVERSFRDDAIRTAVLIDDQFPDYLGMRGATDQDFAEITRARNIYEFMHGKGLICDIQNWRHPSHADLNSFDKVRKSDLIVLDYQLGAAGTKTALKILRHLAVSPHFNLVVLYTAAASARVTLAVAAAMRGAHPPTPGSVPSDEVLDMSEDLLEEGRFRDLVAPELRDYLTTGKTPWSEDLRRAMQEASVPLGNLKALADHVARRWIASLIDDYELDETPQLRVGCAIDGGEPLWVHCGSCFVAVVSKLPASSVQDEGSYLWNRLGAALRSWRPNLYRLILSDMQNALELEAVAHHEDWLDDDLSLGLGLYLLESEAAARGEAPSTDIEGSAQSLIDRFVDIIRRRLATHRRVSATAIDLLGARLKTAIGQVPAGENARLIRARELAHVPPDAKVDWTRRVVPAANAFMVSDEFRGSHITTGTVLRDQGGGFWLCATPACDMVPRESGPSMVQLLRLVRENNPPPKFTAGEFIAITDSGSVTILRALGKDARQPSLVPLVLPGGTRIHHEGERPVIIGWLANGEGLRHASLAHGFAKDGGIRDHPTGPAVGSAPHSEAPHYARSVEATATKVAGPEIDGSVAPMRQDGASNVVPAKLVVLSQLRGMFATRFLTAAGQYLSRVGVDFVDP